MIRDPMIKILITKVILYMADLVPPKEQTVMTSTGKRTFSDVATSGPASANDKPLFKITIKPRAIATVPSMILRRNEATLACYKVRLLDSSCVSTVLQHLGHRPEFVITFVNDNYILVKTLPTDETINMMLRVVGVKDVERMETLI